MNVFDAFYNSIKNNKDINKSLFDKTIDRESSYMRISIEAYLLIDKKIKSGSIEDYENKMNEFLNSFEFSFELSAGTKEIFPRSYTRKVTDFNETQILLGEIGYNGTYGHAQEKFIDIIRCPQEPEMAKLLELPKIWTYLSFKVRPFRSKEKFEEVNGQSKNYNMLLNKAPNCHEIL